MKLDYVRCLLNVLQILYIASGQEKHIEVASKRRNIFGCAQSPKASLSPEKVCVCTEA